MNSEDKILYFPVPKLDQLINNTRSLKKRRNPKKPKELQNIMKNSKTDLKK